MTDTCPVAFFLSDSTGITAETLGNTLITQFPEQHFERHTVPFIVTVERARHYGAIAHDALGIFPDSEEKTALLDVIDFVIDREF